VGGSHGWIGQTEIEIRRDLGFSICVSVSSISRCQRILGSQISPQSTTSSFLCGLGRSEVTGGDSDDEINGFEVMGEGGECWRHCLHGSRQGGVPNQMLSPYRVIPCASRVFPSAIIMSACWHSNRGESTLPFSHFLKIAALSGRVIPHR
jgi:hypothetical protein